MSSKYHVLAKSEERRRLQQEVRTQQKHYRFDLVWAVLLIHQIQSVVERSFCIPIYRSMIADFS